MVAAAQNNTTEKKIAFGIEDSDELLKFFDESKKKLKDLSEKILTPLQKTFKSYTESFEKNDKHLKAINKTVQISDKQLKAYQKSVKDVTKELTKLSKLSGKVNLGAILWGGVNVYGDISFKLTEFGKIAKNFATDITNTWSRVDKVLNRMASSGYDVSIARLKEEMLGLFTLNPIIIEEFTNKSLVAFDQFESSLNQFNTIFGASKSVLQDYGNELQKTVDGPLKNLTNSIDSLAISYQVASGGFSDMEENLSILESIEKLSVGASSPDKFGVGGLVIKSLRSFDKSGDEAGDVAAKLLKMEQLGLTSVKEAQDVLPQAFTSAKAAGLEFEDVLASIDTLTTSGMPTAPSVTALNSFINSVLSMGPEQKKILRELGVTFDDLSNFGPKLQQLSKALGGNIEKLRELFPEMNAFKAAIALTNNEASSFIDNLDQINATTTSTLDDAFENIAQSTEKKFLAIQNSYNELLISFGKAFSEQQNKYIEQYEESGLSIRNIVVENKDLFIELAKSLQVISERIGKVTGTVMAVGKALFSVFTTLLSFKAFTVVFDSLSNKFFGTTNAGILTQTKLIKQLIKQKHGWLKVLGHLVGINQEHKLVQSQVNDVLKNQKNFITDVNLGIQSTSRLSKDAQKELDEVIKKSNTYKKIQERTGFTKASGSFDKQKGKVVQISGRIKESLGRTQSLEKNLEETSQRLRFDPDIPIDQRKEMSSQKKAMIVQLSEEAKLRETLRIQRDEEIRQLKEAGAIKKSTNNKVDAEANILKQNAINLTAAQLKFERESAHLNNLINTQKSLSIRLDAEKLKVNKNLNLIQNLENQLAKVNKDLTEQQNITKQTSITLSQAKKVSTEQEGLSQGKLIKLTIFGNEVIVRNNILHKTNAYILGYVKKQIDATTASLTKKFPWLIKVGNGFTFLSQKVKGTTSTISLFTKGILTKFPFIGKAVDFLKIKFTGLSGAVKTAGLAIAGFMSTIASMAVLTVVMGLIMKVGSLISKNKELSETYKDLRKDVKDHVSDIKNLGLAYNKTDKILLKLSDRLEDANERLNRYGKTVIKSGQGYRDWQAMLSGYTKRAEVFNDLEDALHEGNLEIIKQNKLMKEGIPLSEITNSKIREKILLTSEDFNREEKINKQRIKFINDSIKVQEQRVNILEDKGKKMTDLEKNELLVTKAKIENLEKLKQLSIETYEEQEKYLKVRNQYLDTLKDTQNEVISLNELDNTRNSLSNLNYQLNKEIQSSFGLYQNKILEDSTDFIKSVNDGSIVLKQTLTDLNTDLVGVNENGKETLKINQEAFNTLTKALSGEKIDNKVVKIAELLTLEEYAPLLNSLGAKNKEDIEKIAVNLETLYKKNSDVLKDINTDTFKSIMTSVQVMEDRYKETRRKFLNTDEDILGVTSYITSLNRESEKLENQLDNSLAKINAVIEGQTSYIDNQVNNLIEGLLTGQIEANRDTLAKEFKSLGIAISDISTEKLDKVYESIKGQKKDELVQNLKEIGIELNKTFSFEEIDPQKFNVQINSYLNNISELNQAGEITSKEAVQRLETFTEEIKEYIKPEVYKALQGQVLNIQKNIVQEETLLNQLQLTSYEELYNQKLLLEKTYAKQTFDIQQLITKKAIEIKEAEIETLKKSYSEESLFVQKAEQELINLKLKLQTQEQDKINKLRDIQFKKERRDLKDNLDLGQVTRQNYLNKTFDLETRYYRNLLNEKRKAITSLDKEDELYKDKYAAIMEEIKQIEIEKNRSILEMNKQRIDEQIRLEQQLLDKQKIGFQLKSLQGISDEEFNIQFELKEKQLKLNRDSLLKELDLYRNNADKRKEIELELLENNFEKQKLYRDKEIEEIEREKTKRSLELTKQAAELESEQRKGITEDILREQFNLTEQTLLSDKKTLQERLSLYREGTDEYIQIQAELHSLDLQLQENSEKEKLEIIKFYMQQRLAILNKEQAALTKAYEEGKIPEKDYLIKLKEIQDSILQNDIDYNKKRIEYYKEGSLEREQAIKEITQKETELTQSNESFKRQQIDREYYQEKSKLDIKQAELEIKRSKGLTKQILLEESNLRKKQISIQKEYLKEKLSLAKVGSKEYLDIQKELNLLDIELTKNSINTKKSLRDREARARQFERNLESIDLEKQFTQDLISYEDYQSQSSKLQREHIKERIKENEKLMKSYSKGSEERMRLVEENERLELESLKLIKDEKVRAIELEIKRQQIAFEKFKVQQELKIELLKLEIEQRKLIQRGLEIGFEYEQNLLSIQQERLQLISDKETDRVKKAELNLEIIERQAEIQTKSLEIENQKIESQKESLLLQKESIKAEQEIQTLQLESQKLSIELEIRKAKLLNKSKEDIELLEIQLTQVKQNLSLLDSQIKIREKELILQERQLDNEQLLIQERLKIVGERQLLDQEIAKNQIVIAHLDKQIEQEKLRQQALSISIQKYQSLGQILDTVLRLQDTMISSQQKSIDILTSGVSNLFNLEKSLAKTQIRQRTLERERLDGELSRLDTVQKIQDKQLEFELKRNELARQRQLIEKETELIQAQAAVRLAEIEERKVLANRNSSEEDKEAARLSVEAAKQTLSAQQDIYEVIQKQQQLEAKLDQDRIGQLEFQQEQDRLQLEGEKAKLTISSKDDARVRREANKLRKRSERDLLKQLRELSDFKFKLPERKDITESLKKDLEIYSKNLSKSNAETVTKEIVSVIESQKPILEKQVEILSRILPERMTEGHKKIVESIQNQTRIIENQTESQRDIVEGIQNQKPILEKQTEAISRILPERMTEGHRKIVEGIQNQTKVIENQTKLVDNQVTLAKENDPAFVDETVKQIYEKIDKAMSNPNFDPFQLSEVERSFYEKRQVELESRSLDVWHRLGGFSREDQVKKVWSEEERRKKIQEDAELAKKMGLLEDMPSYAEDQKKYDYRSYNLLKTDIPNIEEIRSLINRESKSTMSEDVRKGSEKIISKQTNTLEEIRDILKDKKESNVTINSPITVSEDTSQLPDFNNQFYKVIEEVQKRL